MIRKIEYELDLFDEEENSRMLKQILETFGVESISSMVVTITYEEPKVIPLKIDNN